MNATLSSSCRVNAWACRPGGAGKGRVVGFGWRRLHGTVALSSNCRSRDWACKRVHVRQNAPAANEPRLPPSASQDSTAGAASSGPGGRSPNPPWPVGRGGRHCDAGSRTVRGPAAQTPCIHGRWAEGGMCARQAATEGAPAQPRAATRSPRQSSPPGDPTNDHSAHTLLISSECMGARS